MLNIYGTIFPVGWNNLLSIGVNCNILDNSYNSLYHTNVISRTINYALIICGRYVATLWHDKRFNQVAILKYVVFVTSPGLHCIHLTCGLAEFEQAGTWLRQRD